MCWAPKHWQLHVMEKKITNKISSWSFLLVVIFGKRFVSNAKHVYRLDMGVLSFINTLNEFNSTSDCGHEICWIQNIVVVETKYWDLLGRRVWPHAAAVSSILKIVIIWFLHCLHQTIFRSWFSSLFSDLSISFINFSLSIVFTK